MGGISVYRGSLCDWEMSGRIVPCQENTAMGISGRREVWFRTKTFGIGWGFATC